MFSTLNHNNKHVKMWNSVVGDFDDLSIQQIKNTLDNPVVVGMSSMPDTHGGYGAPVGSVILTKEAIIPASVGVDIGCGMSAVKTSLNAINLPLNLRPLRNLIEQYIPTGSNYNRKIGKDALICIADNKLGERLESILDKHPAITDHGLGTIFRQLGSLGGGNHFIEICIDLDDFVWIMLHSGSRGIGNQIGTYFIEKAKEEMARWKVDLPDDDLAYLPVGSTYFDDYVEAMRWAQDFARCNRDIMMGLVAASLKKFNGDELELVDSAINCHHNYATEEVHFNQAVWATRKGAVRAGKGELGIIPSAMGMPSYIVSGLGNTDSFHSCAHGAGRAMSRKQARQTITVDDHIKATEGLECKKGSSVIDESPAAYKKISEVMASQTDLVEVVAEIKAVVCCKGS